MISSSDLCPGGVFSGGGAGDAPLAKATNNTFCTPSLQQAEDLALKNRPEIKLNQIAADTNKLDVRLSKELAKPRLDFVGSFTSAGLSGKAGTPGVSILQGLIIPPPPSNLVGGYDQISSTANAAGAPSRVIHVYRFWWVG
jgi:hypothetical protein